MKATSSASNQDFREAEHKLAAELGLELSDRFLDIARPVARARVLECGTGEPVLFVHGGGGMANQWLPLIAAMHGIRAIAVDRPGCGLSDTYDYADEPSVRHHAVEFLGNVIDALGLSSVDVVGNSMGGLWALWFALERPERVRSLVLVGCPALVVGTSAPVAMRLMSRTPLGRVLEARAKLSTMRRVMKMMGHSTAVLDQLPAGLMELSVQGGNIAGAGHSFRSLLARMLRLRGAQADCALDAEQLSLVEVPVAVIWGSNDPFGDLDAAQRVAAAVSAQVRVVGEGHLPWIDDPRGVATELESFLSRSGDRIG